jgi:predicted acetyltransferase
MDVEIRPIAEAEFEAWVQANEIAFGAFPAAEDVARERSVAELDRTFGAFDGDEIVGTAASFTLRMRVPGGAEVPTAGVTMVGVKPTHRRHGINTALMRRLLEQSRERGEPLAALFASEGGIYGRFGYGVATFNCSIDLETDRADFVRGYRPSGRVRLLPLEAAVPVLAEIYRRAAASRPGTIAMDETRIRYSLHDHGDAKDLPFFFAVHEGGDGPDATAIYKVKHDWPGSVPMTEMVVDEVQALTPQAYADIWRFLLDVDLVHRVRASALAPDEPLLHLLAEPRRLRLTLRDGLWLRPVDVLEALAARRYAAAGRIVLEVRDRFCPWNDGRVALEAGPDGAACTSTDEPADLACSVSVLGSVFLGGASFRQLWRAGQVEDVWPGALERADAMFASDPAPWCPFAF